MSSHLQAGAMKLVSEKQKQRLGFCRQSEEQVLYSDRAARDDIGRTLRKMYNFKGF